MEVIRYSDTKPYKVAKHFDMQAFRLQGFDTSSAKTCWVGLSLFLPGGGAETDATPIEKIYVVLTGEITIEVEGEAFTLGPRDSCVIAASESRSIINNTNDVATMLVIMGYPGS